MSLGGMGYSVAWPLYLLVVYWVAAVALVLVGTIIRLCCFVMP